jgi:hypothetical protein
VRSRPEDPLHRKVAQIKWQESCTEMDREKNWRSNMKRFLILSLALVAAPALKGASSPPRYRIDLRHGGTVFSRDLPFHRGSIVLFHQVPGGVLTGLPEEEVLGIQAASSNLPFRKQAAVQTGAATAVVGSKSAIQTLAEPLQPGDVLVIGPTGGGSAKAAGQPGAIGGINNGVANGASAGNGANSSMASGAVPPGFAPNGQPFVPAPGDLARAPSGNPPTMGTNGFPINSNHTTFNVGPNGSPIVAGSSQTAPQPGSNPPIGANGFPTTATVTNGTPATATQPIGPNGFPAPGTTTLQPGAAQPIGPNGFPAPAAGSPAGTAPAGTAPVGSTPAGNAPSGNVPAPPGNSGVAPAGQAPAKGAAPAASAHP